MKMSDSMNIKSNSSQNEPAMKGWLFKWTNYLKGYQRRWFVLQSGHLSYYRNSDSPLMDNFQCMYNTTEPVRILEDD